MVNENHKKSHVRKLKGNKNISIHSPKRGQMKGGKTDTEFYVQASIIAILLLVIVFSLGK